MHECNSMSTSGVGDRGVAILMVRGGVDGARSWVEGVCRGAVVDVRWPVMSGSMAAIRIAVASPEEVQVEAEHGPVRPRDLISDSRPLCAPSKSGVLGGSCFVESPAALDITNQCHYTG
jgi:hypothetical protein